MSKINKPLLRVFLKDDNENFCSKCCKTRQVIERMIQNIPNLKNAVAIEYKDIFLKETVERFGEMTPPVVMINNHIFSEGHVPIIKKLSGELLSLIYQT